MLIHDDHGYPFICCKDYAVPVSCAPFPPGRKHLPGSCAPSLPGRKQFPGNCAPSFPGRRQPTTGAPQANQPGRGNSPSPTPFPLGKVVTPKPLPKQVKLTPQIGPSGQVTGVPIGIGFPSPPRRTTLSPGKTTAPTPPTRSPQGSSKEDPNPRWVINLSSKPLTQAQRSVLAKGPNYVVTPRQPPNLEYITAIEVTCTKLSQQDAEELRANINRVLMSSPPPNPT